MKIKLLNLVILFCVFAYGVIVGHYKTFPYNMLLHNKTLFHKTKSTILNYVNFSKNKECVMNINKEIELTKNQDYSFFIAGHAYGSPSSSNLGLYPKFYKELLTNKNIFDFGILAGDVTRNGDKESWDFFDVQINNLDYKIYIAPGNHDIGSTENSIKKINFKKRYGNLYQSIKFKNDLFIILNPYENKWSIKNQQLDFLKKELQQNYQLVDNIFIISHPVIYINEKLNVKVNGYNGMGENINFWDEIYPLLKKYSNNYYVIAGDVGATDNGFELFCDKFEKTIFLATGMGGGRHDNFLIFKKIKNKIKIVAETF